MIRDFFIHPSSAYYPIMASVITFLWGVWAIVFNSIHHLPFSFILLSIEPGWVWGVIAIVLSILQILWLISKSSVFKAGTFLMFYFWAFLAICLGLADYHAPSLLLYSWVALFIGLGWVNRKSSDG